MNWYNVSLSTPVKPTPVAIILLVILLCSCAREAEPHHGVWKGDAFFVEMKYEFSVKKFDASTNTLNGLQVGGGSGTYVAENGQITMYYDRKYVYDNRENRGSWESDDKEIVVAFYVDGDRMQFDYVGTSQSIELERQ